MKQIGIILSVVFLISCSNQSRVKFKPTIDSNVFVVYRAYPAGLTGTRGKYSTQQVKAVDSNDKVITKVDTTWTLEIVNTKDTVKDSKGKPIYDFATHSYRFNNQWYKLTDQENKTIKIQIIKI